MLVFLMGPKAIWSVLKAAAAKWGKDNAARLGAALSYYTIFAIPPLFVIVIFIASLWVDQKAVHTELFGEVGGLIGQKGADAIESALNATNPHAKGLLASILAVGALILTASGLFIELQGALNAIWGVQAKPGQGIWGFIKNRLLSFSMLLVIGFLLLVSMVVSVGLAAAGKYFSGLAPGLGVISTIISLLVSFAVITVLFAMIFKILPDVRIAWRDVWVGAAITALLFTTGKFLLGLYLAKNSTVSAYGAAGSLVLILLWVYYSAQILFFGAEFTQVYANRFGVRLEPKRHAQWVLPPEKPPASATPVGRKSQALSELKGRSRILAGRGAAKFG
jgi:membrane protein